ncbi:hypothetical protein HGRIS_010919 [Hohenbuehelia grisea]|uniref:Uncharacterized protein n=1 Tax=Hohenbuehelia grisea TaxID=104357 RepID=A0ABR3IYK7_9AGAR
MSALNSHQPGPDAGQATRNAEPSETQPLLSAPSNGYSSSIPGTVTPLPSYTDSAHDEDQLSSRRDGSADAKRGSASPKSTPDSRPTTPRPSDQELEAARGNTEQPTKRSLRSKAFTGVIFILAGVLLFLFIKAFIDADDTDFDFKKALKKALGGGLSGAAAMVLQVLSLMPLRTTMNYQYRFGTTTSEAIRTLYGMRGIARFYDGLGAALIQGPVSRFGDTAANAGILALLESNTFMRKLPSPVKTVFVSLSAAAFRIILTPVDTLKTTLQTQGRVGVQILKDRVRADQFCLLQPPHAPVDQEIRHYYALVWSLGHSSCHLCRKLSLVCNVQLSRRSSS